MSEFLGVAAISLGSFALGALVMVVVFNAFGDLR
jgi:hypothetical protein